MKYGGGGGGGTASSLPALCGDPGHFQQVEPIKNIALISHLSQTSGRGEEGRGTAPLQRAEHTNTTLSCSTGMTPRLIQNSLDLVQVQGLMKLLASILLQSHFGVL